MTSLLLIPQGIDLSKPDQVAKAQIFKDAIDNWQDLEDKEYYIWQEFILCFGTFEETTSDNWLDNILHMSMETTLHAEIESDIFSIPIQQRGLILTLRCIIKRMVTKNQESKDALENYIRGFNITKFPGENVATACLPLKAVARALEDYDLPSNTIRKVLEGFGKSSTKLFNNFCSSQIALRRGSFYADIMQGTSLLSQLSNLFNDIQVTYLDLVGGNSWLGIAAAPTQSSFMAKVQEDKDEREAQALAVKSNLPWDEWVKLHIKCHHCGEKGHICPQCPDYLKKMKSGEIKHAYCPNYRSQAQARPTNRGLLQACCNNFLKDPKAKAFLSAFQALFTPDDDDVNIGNGDEDLITNKGDNEQDEGDDKDIYNFLSMVGSLKE